MSSKNQIIDKQAADWAAQRDLRELTSEEQAQFESWLAADSRHLGAYGRAEAVLSRLERLNTRVTDALGAEAPPRQIWRGRRAILAGGVAASVLLGLGIAFRFHNEPRRDLLATEIGQTKEVVLSDGSIVSLNTNTRLQVEFTTHTRNVRILQGEALFDVAKNKLRPFIVSAGGVRVRAVGTSFAVSVLPQRPVEILVREGTVEVQRSDLTFPMREPIRASANVKVVSPPGAPVVTISIPEEKIALDLAWRRGSIALADQTLKDAADEFARYSEIQIVVDPAISDKTVTGLFAANDPIGFAKAAARALKLKWEVKNKEVRIF